MAEYGPLDALHPAIRIILLIVLATGVAVGSPAHLFVFAILVVLVYLFQRPAPWRSAGRMLRRLRWFFVSLLVLFFWFTPGDPLLFADAVGSRWLPTREGVIEGTIRISALVVIVLAVNLILATTPREQLLAGLLWLAAPLEKLGADRERFALRVALVLDAVPKVQELLGEARCSIATHRARGFAAVGTTAGRALETALREADNASLSPLPVQLGTAPPVWQWVLPAALIVGGWWGI